MWLALQSHASLGGIEQTENEQDNWNGNNNVQKEMFKSPNPMVGIAVAFIVIRVFVDIEV